MMPPSKRQPSRWTMSSTASKEERPSRVTRSGKAGNKERPSRVTRSGKAGMVYRVRSKRHMRKMEIGPSRRRYDIKDIEFVCQYDVGEACSSIQHSSAAANILVVGGEKSVKFIDVEKDDITSLGYSQAVVSENEGDLFVCMRHQDDTVDVIKHSILGQASKRIFSYRMGHECTIANISVSGQYIACIDRDVQSVRLFNRCKDTLTTTLLHKYTQASEQQQQKQPHYDIQQSSAPLYGRPSIQNLCFKPDGSLLVTYHTKTSRGNQVSRLANYRISEQNEFIPVWTAPCPYVQGADGIAMHEDGAIFVSDAHNKILHVVSSEGSKLYEVHNERLPALCGNISIRGDMLAVCGRSNSNIVQLFKIVTRLKHD